MSAPNTGKGPTFQPYECHVCQSRFTRHENLKRHATLHSRPRRADSLSCAFCQATFSRPDLRTRHMKRKHPDEDPSQWSTATTNSRSRSNARGQNSTGGQHAQKSSSTDGPSPISPSSASPSSLPFAADSHIGSWQIYGTSEDGGTNRASFPESASNYPNSTPGSSPAENDGAGLPIIYNNRSYQHRSHTHTHRGSGQTDSPISSLHLEAHPLLAPFSPSRTVSFSPCLSHFDFNLPQLRDSWPPSNLQVRDGTQLFFAHISHFVPFFHEPTFDMASIPDFLQLAMLCLAYQYGDDPEKSHVDDSGPALSVRCYHRALASVAVAEDNHAASASGDPQQTLAIVQSYLLLEIFAMLYIPNGGKGCETSTSSKSADGTAMHARLIALVRAGGLMQPLPAESLTTQDLQSLWLQFARNEAHKRTMFAIHQVDALWYQLLSIPRSISHLEIKHDLPCPEDDWVAPSAAEWAHRRLMSSGAGGNGHGSGNGPISYAEAVRRFLSSDEDSVVLLPPFDAYGAINIAQFLISSARELSGWSTITGVLSLERLQPLKSSLIALSPSIHPPPNTAKATHAALMCEAIWEIAMIELQLWSPAHTDGIVCGSIDDILRQSAQLPPLSRFLYESTTIQPHVDWFLHYLEATVTPTREAPWIPLYAYRVFLIAYQLVCEGIPGAMQVVGVEDGDVRGALLWAEKVFRRRRQWHLGRVILDCLSRLDKPE